MQLFGKNIDEGSAIVAEIGVNHEGSLDKAIELLHLAHASGADAAKFQTFTPERFVSAQDPDRLKRVRAFDLGERGLKALKAEADKLDFNIFSTAVSDDVVPLLTALFDVVKIASGDLDFEPTIKAAAQSGKKTIISTGLGTAEEVAQAVHWFKAAAGTDDIRDRLILMQCVSAYPVPIEQAQVGAMSALSNATGLRVGYSNHIIGLEACFAAAALGAPIIEVHFTDCKTGREFRDHALSCDPSDMETLVAAVPRIRASIGSGTKERQPAEVDNLIAVRKGVIAARNLSAGTVLRSDDLVFARPASEFAAHEIIDLPGKTLNVDLKMGDLIPRSGISQI